MRFHCAHDNPHCAAPRRGRHLSRFDSSVALCGLWCAADAQLRRLLSSYHCTRFAVDQPRAADRSRARTERLVPSRCEREPARGTTTATSSHRTRHERHILDGNTFAGRFARRCRYSEHSRSRAIAVAASAVVTDSRTVRGDRRSPHAIAVGAMTIDDVRAELAVVVGPPSDAS